MNTISEEENPGKIKMFGFGWDQQELDFLKKIKLKIKFKVK
jgi:hypothetical protein